MTEWDPETKHYTNIIEMLQDVVAHVKLGNQVFACDSARTTMLGYGSLTQCFVIKVSDAILSMDKINNSEKRGVLKTAFQTVEGRNRLSDLLNQGSFELLGDT